VRRVRPRSPSARIGVERGDRLLGIGGTALDSRAALGRRLVELRGAESVLLSVGRGRYQYNVQVPLAPE
jgi:S1-C subfamily serine protease